MKPRECLFCGSTFTPPADDPQALYCGADCASEAEIASAAFAYVLQQPLPFLVFQAWLQDRLLREWLRQLVWQQGTQQFMVCEDFTFADVHSRQVVLNENEVTAINPMPPQWQTVFYEYGIVVFGLHVATVEVFEKIRYAPLIAFVGQFTLSEEFGKALARNPYLTSAQYSQLAHHPILAVREILAWNQALDEAPLLLLARDVSVTVRSIVAQNPCTPLTILHWLYASNDPTIQQNIAFNTAAPPAMLTILVQHPQVEVRKAVASNPNADIIFFNQLAADPDPLVRVRVATNLRTPITTLQRLLDDPDFSVQTTVRENLWKPRSSG
jgi:hypothetical protein